MTYTKLTFPQKLQVWEAMEKVCHKNAEGFAEYTNGASDQTLCDQFDFATLSQIQSTRKEMVGTLAKPGSPSPRFVELEARIADLESKVERMRQAMKLVSQNAKIEVKL